MCIGFLFKLCLGLLVGGGSRDNNGAATDNGVVTAATLNAHTERNRQQQIAMLGMNQQSTIMLSNSVGPNYTHRYPSPV